MAAYSAVRAAASASAGRVRRSRGSLQRLQVGGPGGGDRAEQRRPLGRGRRAGLRGVLPAGLLRPPQGGQRAGRVAGGRSAPAAGATAAAVRRSRRASSAACARVRLGDRGEPVGQRRVRGERAPGAAAASASDSSSQRLAAGRAPAAARSSRSKRSQPVSGTAAPPSASSAPARSSFRRECPDARSRCVVLPVATGQVNTIRGRSGGHRRRCAARPGARGRRVTLCAATGAIRSGGVPAWRADRRRRRSGEGCAR